MADITELILADHTWFRQQFARLDDLQAQQPLNVDAVQAVWDPLAARLDMHAIAEEKIFYPQLLKWGGDPEAETLDAIGDHNDIRDGVHAAQAQPIGADEWWSAVGQARKANDEHMAEEEREGLADFRQHAPARLRDSLGTQFAEYLGRHPTTAGVDTSDKDPEEYVDDIEAQLQRSESSSGSGAATSPPDESLGIGSLKSG